MVNTHVLTLRLLFARGLHLWLTEGLGDFTLTSDTAVSQLRSPLPSVLASARLTLQHVLSMSSGLG